MDVPNELSWLHRMRSAGLRVTRGRLVVLSYLESHTHSTAAEIQAGVADDLPSLSKQSVYNVVNDLSQLGLVRRLDLPGSDAARYETNTGNNHHHFQCLECGRVEDVDCLVGVAPCLKPGRVDGVATVLTAEITFRGICESCTSTSSTPRVPRPIDA